MIMQDVAKSAAMYLLCCLNLRLNNKPRFTDKAKWSNRQRILLLSVRRDESILEIAQSMKGKENKEREKEKKRD